VHFIRHANLSPAQQALQLGERLKQARLNQNITQEQIAEQIGVSRRTVINAEKGEATLLTFISILQVLKLTHQLDAFLPQQSVSPVQLAKLQGQQRQRASGNFQVADAQEDESQW